MWKQHRARMHGGTITPLGAAPDGLSWTGFASHVGPADGYLLFFRELNDLHEATFDVPMFPAASYTVAP